MHLRVMVQQSANNGFWVWFLVRVVLHNKPWQVVHTVTNQYNLLLVWKMGSLWQIVEGMWSTIHNTAVSAVQRWTVYTYASVLWEADYGGLGLTLLWIAVDCRVYVL